MSSHFLLWGTECKLVIMSGLLTILDTTDNDIGVRVKGLREPDSQSICCERVPSVYGKEMEDVVT